MGLNGANKSVLSSLAELIFHATQSETHFRGTNAKNIAAFGNKEVILRIEVSGIADEVSNLSAGLVEVHYRHSNGLFKHAPDSEPGMNENTNPSNFRLIQNYPNPFNPTTTIRYELPPGKDNYFVTLKIYDALGRLVKTLVEEYQASGIYQVTWDGRDMNGGSVASGIYFYAIQAGGF